MAEALRVHPTLITQVLKGHKSFNMDQAYSLAQFMEFIDLEKDYFLTLIDFDRAGKENEKNKNRVPMYATMSARED